MDTKVALLRYMLVKVRKDSQFFCDSTVNVSGVSRIDTNRALIPFKFCKVMRS